MNARTLQEADAGTDLEVIRPVLFNTWKHHAGALRCRIEAVAAGGPAALIEMATRVAVLGTKLMDFYTGSSSPRTITRHILDHLRTEGHFEPADFQSWLAENNAYATVDLPDGSRWVLRVGDEAERYVHLHPGRWSPLTVRMRANVLKTALLVLIQARIDGTNPMDRTLINHVRTRYLGLSPLGRDPEGEEGLGSALMLLGG